MRQEITNEQHEIIMDKIRYEQMLTRFPLEYLVNLLYTQYVCDRLPLKQEEPKPSTEAEDRYRSSDFYDDDDYYTGI